MAEAAQGRVQEAVESAVEALERENLRAMQAAMFRCSAGCCEDAAASPQQLQSCLQRCQAPLARAQALLAAELERFQARLSRCALGCSDGASEALEAGAAAGRARAQLDACLAACGDEQLARVPAMARRLRDGLAALRQ